MAEPFKVPLWHQGHYNVVAKEIREELVAYRGIGKMDACVRGVLIDLALCFAKRFKKDNEHFDHLKWLDQCSPDPVIYPISELWDD